jgi:hypothetical protein
MDFFERGSCLLCIVIETYRRDVLQRVAMPEIAEMVLIVVEGLGHRVSYYRTVIYTDHYSYFGISRSSSDKVEGLRDQ